MILVLFLYKAVDNTKVSNKKFEQHINSKDYKNWIYKIMAEDIAESSSSISIKADKNNNSIVSFSSNNTYNNSFYNNIIYLISSSKKLVRIESKDKLEKDKEEQFFKNSFIDILSTDIKNFKVTPKDDKYIILIENEKNQKIYISVFKLAN
jgi:hypothetical protein